MAANLDLIAFPHVVGIMDRPGREPGDAPLDLAQMAYFRRHPIRRN